METTPERNAVQPSRPGNKDTKGDVAASNSSQDVKSSTNLEARLHRRLRGISLSKHQPALSASKHVRIQEEVQKPVSSASSIYRGSFNYTPRRSMASLGESLKSQPLNSRGAFDAAQLEGLLTDLHMDLETYDMEELRDGFFDASFAKPPKSSPDDLVRDAEETLPRLLRMEHPLSVSNFLPDQWAGVKEVVKLVFTTRAGIKLLKSFLSFFIAYTICLIPTSSKWLGKYNYIIAISTIINHAGRPVGAQIDGFVATVSGTVVGLGWGAFALWLSNSTSVARRGYGGVLVTFLILFMAPLSALRSYYIRLYQFVLCAGMSIIYTCLADTSDDVRWRKFFDYGIPWVLGQALCLIICCTVWPDAGARPLAVALHDSLNTMQQSLSLPQEDPIRIHRLLAMAFVNLSQAQRDFSIDFSLSRFDPDDVRDLRNLMQAVIRSLLSLKMEAHVFNDHEELKLKDASRYHTAAPNMDNSRVSVPDIQIDTVLDIDKPRKVDLRERTRRQEQAAQLVVDKLADPTLDCLLWIETALQRCDAVLMDMSGYRRYLGPPKETSSDILQVLTKMRKNMIKYDAEEDALLRHPGLPQVYSDHPDVVQMLLFSRPVRQAATATENLLIKVMAMQQKKPGWRPYLPSYPFKKGLQRTNAQVRHDRGGVTAGYYFRSQSELADSLGALSTTYKPLPRSIEADSEPMPLKRRATFAQLNQDGHLPNDYNPKEYEKRRIRYRLWKILHRLQGFETRFGLKVAIVTSLLAIPAWLDSSRGWWNENEIWWAIVIVWVMMHPRVGGNVQDLFTRALCAVLGTIWGALAYAAGDGNPFVMAVFCAVFMLPMLYRFTQSSHPRSGVVACIAFTVVSLGANVLQGQPSVIKIAWTRGAAFVVGIVAAVVINWILWPFVARHELRKALAAMMVYCSIVYRGVVSKYLYFNEANKPDAKDIARSEMLEGRLREGFVRMRQLMALTRHEPRLRGPFNPLPYSALIFSLERFFEYLVEIRQSSIFFHPYYLSDDRQAAEALLTSRRDAVSAVLMNLYILASGLRIGRRIPRFLPNAAWARKRLLDQMALLETSRLQSNGSDGGRTINGLGSSENSSDRSTTAHSIHTSDTGGKGKEKADGDDSQHRKWSEVYSYSYSQSLTGCIQQLEQLQKYTKEICGEQGFDILDLNAFDGFIPERTGNHSRA